MPSKLFYFPEPDLLPCPSSHLPPSAMPCPQLGWLRSNGPVSQSAPDYSALKSTGTSIPIAKIPSPSRPHDLSTLVNHSPLTS